MKQKLILITAAALIVGFALGYLARGKGHLESLLGSSNPEKHKKGIAWISRIGSEDSAAIVVDFDLLSDKMENSERLQIFRILQNQKNDKTIKYLKKYSDSKEPEIRFQAQSLLIQWEQFPEEKLLTDLEKFYQNAEIPEEKRVSLIRTLLSARSSYKTSDWVASFCQKIIKDNDPKLSDACIARSDVSTLDPSIVESAPASVLPLLFTQIYRKCPPNRKQFVLSFVARAKKEAEIRQFLQTRMGQLPAEDQRVFESSLGIKASRKDVNRRMRTFCSN